MRSVLLRWCWCVDGGGGTYYYLRYHSRNVDICKWVETVQMEWHCWCGSSIVFWVLTEYPFLIATPSIVTVEAASILSTWVPREGSASVPPPSSTARDPSGLVPLMMSVLPTTLRVAVMSISTSNSISQVVSEAQSSMAFLNPGWSETLTVVVTAKKRWEER